MRAGRLARGRVLVNKKSSSKDLRSETPGVGLVKAAEAGLQSGAGPEQTAGKGAVGSRPGQSKKETRSYGRARAGKASAGLGRRLDGVPVRPAKNSRQAKRISRAPTVYDRSPVIVVVMVLPESPLRAAA